MHLTSLEEYGIRCALQLARAYQAGPVAASSIAAKEGLSTEYASKIMHLFRKSGLVSSTRGNQGGFILARAPGEIYLKEIFDAVSVNAPTSETKSEFCSEYTGHNNQCTHHSNCSVRPVWQMIFSYVEDVFRAITLEHLVNDEQQARRTLSNVAVMQAKKLSGSFGG